ncbi:ankyrin repeat-containing domain protein [Armillaria nabsnona]|nr:ankyrin repeat-containing domain protein [Armillaria nabsnona]
MSDPEHPPIPSAPPYGDYSHTTPVVSAPGDEIAPPPPPLPAQSCAKSHAFHLAIAQHDYDLVSHLVTSTPTLATPNTLSCYGNTPLFTAVRARDTKIARLLITHGADINGWSSPLCSQVDIDHFLDNGMVPRTPLMEAASTGQIAMVKLLMKDYAAEDTLVALDGQTALRLAAANKQREITAFLPSRRLGAFKRIRFRSRKAIRRIKSIALTLYDIGKFFFWEIPKFVLWTIPKKISQEVWRNITRVGRFIFWTVPKFFLYHLPKFFIIEFPWVEFGERLWWTIKDVAQWLWEDVIKPIPGFVKRVTIKVYDLLATFVKNIGKVLESFFSLLHTVVLAIWTLLKEITLRDVWNAICDLGRAIFMDLPRAVWQGVKALYRVLNKTLRCTLEIAWEVLKGVYRVVVYIPKQLLRICKEVGAVAVRLGKEIIVYIRPKTMLA